jgi:TonB family protein
MRLRNLCLPLIAAGLCVADETALRVTEAEAKKAAIEKPSPEYPLVARQLKVVGKVNLEAVISATGHVAEVRILSGNPVLTKPSVEAVKHWRFKPFQSGGKPVDAIAPLTFDFDTH